MPVMSAQRVTVGFVATVTSSPVCDFKKHVGMARLIERTEAREIFSAQSIADIATKYKAAFRMHRVVTE